MVKQLDSDKFAERQAAGDKLSEIGKPAIEALAEAAMGDGLEVTVRSIGILQKLLDSSHEATKEAAKGALEKIAKCDRPSAARRAQDALKSGQPVQIPAAQIIPGQIMPGVIQIAVAGGGAQRISVRNVNGVKTVEAEEGDRKVKIVEDPNQGIQMELTTKKDGKETTEKYTAKNAGDLKKKHPKAYEVYDKYSRQGGNFAVQVQIGGGGMLPVAVQPRRFGSVDAAARMLSAWASQLERMASAEAIRQASKESNEELKKKVAEVRKQLAELEKRLQEAIEKPKQAAEDEQKQK